MEPNSTTPNVTATQNNNVAAAAPAFGNGGSVVEGKGGKKTGWVLGIILCLILAAGGIGFGVWEMMDGNAQKDDLNGQIEDLRKQNNELMEKIGNSVSSGVDKDIDTSDSWDKFSRSLASQNLYVVGYYSHYNGTSNELNVAGATKDANGHLVITDSGNNMGTDNSVILELDDVLSVYFIRVGNGGVPYFYIVDMNGGVSRIDISEQSSRQLEKVGDHTRIATILEEAVSEAILVDIDGNIYKSH